VSHNAAAEWRCFDEVDRRLIDEWQRGWPLISRPYAAVAAALGTSEADVLARLERLVATDVVARVGAVVRPNTAGASTLAALAVPPGDLDAAVAIVNGEAGVTHNYEREHAYNLWFVITGRDDEDIAATISRIEARTALPVLDLPLRRAFHIDLGFPIFSEQSVRPRASIGAAPPDPKAGGSGGKPRPAGEQELALLAAIEDGLPLTSHPFRSVAAELGRREMAIIADLGNLLGEGVVARFGLIVRHRQLGFTANAMVVWDVADDRVEEVARRFAAHSFVTLCYERPRRAERWPYNLFCMIHGRDRGAVAAQIALLTDSAGRSARACAPLFSRRCFRHRGARFSGGRHA
jgi:DNA-binding Lrp family transcriptional regulator